LPLTNHHETTSMLSLLASIGAAVGLGHLFVSKEKLTMRLVIGRALSAGGLGAASAALIGLFPNIPLAAQCGVAALLASLGTSGIERLFRTTFGLDD
jgi:hypothetical protein